MSISSGDEHYCVEAPLTLEGKAKLEAMTRDWDKAKFPRVDMVVTDWVPPKREWDRKFDADLAGYETLLKATRDAHERYQNDVAEVEAKKARDTAAAKVALDKFAPNAPPMKPRPPKASASARRIAKSICARPAAIRTSKETVSRARG